MFQFKVETGIVRPPRAERSIAELLVDIAQILPVQIAPLQRSDALGPE